MGGIHGRENPTNFPIIRKSLLPGLGKGLSVEALAARLYPDVPAANARMNLNRLRKPQINGKPKRLSFGDFIDLCMALDMVPERIVSQTITEVLEQEK